MLVVEVFDQSEVHKGIILDLASKVSVLESKVEIKDVVINEVGEILTVEVERGDLTKQQVRKMKRDNVRKWFINAYDKMLYAAGGLSVGVGIGIGVGFGK